MKRLDQLIGFWIAGSIVALVQAQAQQQAPKTPADQIKAEFADIHRKVLDMAKDFPADKYGYRMKPEMRSFGDLIVHITSGVAFAAKTARGEKAKWDELNAKDYPNKAAAVALLEKSVADANTAMGKLPAAEFTKSVEPWVAVLEHSGEHYGLLVAYYRANGMVPPESRPKGGK